MGRGLQHPSGRVIALGRLMLASLFLLAIWVDASQPAHAPNVTYALLSVYLLFALTVTVTTWNNWWLDAKLAGPSHAIDIFVFALLVMLTQGHTSPFFTAFMFLLLSAAIRWGWRATALTAILLALLYIIAGLLVLGSNVDFERQPFLVRTGHLIILSLILIWFGANQNRARLNVAGAEGGLSEALAESPLESGLRAAMDSIGAATGVFVWRDREAEEVSAVRFQKDVPESIGLPASAIDFEKIKSPFLYDVRKARALKNQPDRGLVEFPPSEVLPASTSKQLSLDMGLAIPVESNQGQGVLFLEAIPNLSNDHLGDGEQISIEVGSHIQRHALLKAAEEGAEARFRLTLARDLHDSVVQCLAGAAFRLEAIKRSQTMGRDVEPDLNELKQLLMEEQRELRSFITALRSGPMVPLNDLSSDLRTLAHRLSQQWDVSCTFTARQFELMIPTRLRLDAHQLMREAVANAVRHAEAKSVNVELEAGTDELLIEFVNDGGLFPKRDGRIELPASLKERAEQAGGSLDVARGMGVTKLSISLPIHERRR